MASVVHGAVPFQEQIEFFRRKINLPTAAWTDIYTKEHDWAFVVAGANRDEIVSAFRTSIDKAIVDGMTLEEFRRDFDAIVEKTGWEYKGGRNWRSRVIFETNMRTSYAAGRYQQLQVLKRTRPFWRYLHSDAVVHPRPEHLAWHNLVLPADDPWWDTHFGPNGWGCQCTVEGLNQRDLLRLGLEVGTAPPIEMRKVIIGKRSPNGPREVTVPAGIDPGFEYTPGKARMLSEIPPERPTPPVSGTAGAPGIPNTRRFTPLPAPRKVPKSMLLREGLSAEKYSSAFLGEFGAAAKMPAIFADKVGERLVIGEQLFTDRTTGVNKADKNSRGPWMKILALALKAPDEIWIRMEWNATTGAFQVRRRYVAAVQVGDDPRPLLVVFDRGADNWWTGITAHPGNKNQVDAWRVGVRLYRRPEE